MTDDECARGKGKFLQDRWIVGDCRWLKPVLVGKFEFLGGPETVAHGIPSSWGCGTTRRRAT